MKDHWSSTTHECSKCKFPCKNARALRCHISRNCKVRTPKNKIQENSENTSTTLNKDEDTSNRSIEGDHGDKISDNDDEDWPLVNETEDDDNDNVPDSDDTQIPIKIKPEPKSIQKKRPTNSSTPKEYSCKICLTTCLFATPWSFARHKQQHKLSKFPCPKCRYPCQTDWALQIHLSQNQCNKRTCYKCDYCDFTTDINLKFIQHKSVHRKERQCKKEKLGTSDLNFSDKKNYKGWQLRCKICLCQRIYTNMGSYLRHLKHHQYRTHLCPTCNYPCQSEETLKVHQKRKLCNLEKEFQCDFCDWKSTESRAALLKHRLEVHQEKRKYAKKLRQEKKNKDFRCTYCSFKTIQQKYLDEHVKRVKN